MNDKRNLRAIQAQRFLRYSIRKFNVGVASVAIASGLAVLGGVNVQAAEEATNKITPTTEAVATTVATTKPATEAATTPVTEKENGTVENKENKPVAEKVEIAKKADKTKLSSTITRLEAALEKAASTEKTASAIESAKAELATAKALVANETATQADVDKAVKELNNKAFVVESMPKATEDKKEEKENKNQDSRNGQVIPGQGESGFRATSYVVGSDNQPNVSTDANTGKSKLTFEAPTPEKIESIKEGLKKNTVQPSNLNVNNVTAVGGGGASNVIVQGTGGTPTTLELEILSNQHVGEETNPAGIGSVMRKGRQDYPLSPEDAKKLEAEAPLWKGKLKPDGSKVSTNAGEQYGNTGGYEFLATEIYKLGYEQGVDRVYIPNIKQRIALTEAAKAAGWEVKSITPTNLPPGLIYDEKTDTIQGRVVAPVQNGVYDFRLAVNAENKTTNQTTKVTLADLRVGWIGWQDTKPPKI